MYNLSQFDICENNHAFLYVWCVGNTQPFYPHPDSALTTWIETTAQADKEYSIKDRIEEFFVAYINHLTYNNTENLFMTGENLVETAEDPVIVVVMHFHSLLLKKVHVIPLGALNYLLFLHVEKRTALWYFLGFSLDKCVIEGNGM